VVLVAPMVFLSAKMLKPLAVNSGFGPRFAMRRVGSDRADRHVIANYASGGMTSMSRAVDRRGFRPIRTSHGFAPAPSHAAKARRLKPVLVRLPRDPEIARRHLTATIWNAAPDDWTYGDLQRLLTTFDEIADQHATTSAERPHVA
jgi:hypothetical protein